MKKQLGTAKTQSTGTDMLQNYRASNITST